jgi:small-conductance mechanosensitive channel
MSSNDKYTKMRDSRPPSDISDENSHESENTRLISSIGASAKDEITPSEVGEDPMAAQDYNIEKRLLSVAFDKDMSPDEIYGQYEKNKKDSFDWLEDDRDLYEITRGLYTGPPVTLKSKSSLYDNVQPDNPQSLQFIEDKSDQDSDESDDGDQTLLLPTRLYYGIMLTIQVTLLVLSAMALSGYNLGSFAGLPLQYWTLIGSLIVFMPLLCSWALMIIVKTMRHSGAFGGGELPSFIDSMKTPIILLSTTLTVFTFWFQYFPRGCPPHDSPISFCFYEYADKIFYGLVIISLGFATEIVVMFFATLRFHERNFKTRIISSRFKIYIVQQIALKALEAVHQRSMNSSILTSASRDNLNLRHSSEEPTYIGELFKLFKSFFSTSTIVDRSQRAANFVQIHVEDQTATVPVTHSSSQSYEKFSQTLKKHMKLYGYAQFAQNKSGLKDREARILARDLFNFLCPRGKDVLTYNDIVPCFVSCQAANDAYDIFDHDQDGFVSKKEFRDSIVSIYAELRDMTKSIRNAGSALEKLDTILKLFFVIVIALALLTLFNFNITNLLTLTLSAVIGLNFVIGDLARHFLSSMILLFVTHPFDIGDTIVVGLFEEGCYLKDIFTVKHINLLNSVFTRWNGQETYVPNHMLANAPFMTNLSRTIEQWEMIEFKVPSTIPESVLTDLRHEIGGFLQTHTMYYFRVFEMHAIVAADMGNSEKTLDTLQFNLRVKCKPTSDAQKRWARHAKLLKFVKITLEEFVDEKTIEANSK